MTLEERNQLLERISAAILRIVDGQACMRIPAEPTDPDLVLADCKRVLLCPLVPKFTDAQIEAVYREQWYVHPSEVRRAPPAPIPPMALRFARALLTAASPKTTP